MIYVGSRIVYQIPVILITYPENIVDISSFTMVLGVGCYGM